MSFIKDFLNHPVVIGADPQEWGRTCSSINEFVQMDMLTALRYCVTRVKGLPYDLLVDGHRVQSKLRQVNGLTPFSTAVTIETTRRQCRKNDALCSNGLVCYALDEFDFLLVSLVHKTSNRQDPSTWYFSMIPASELVDGDRMASKITPTLLQTFRVGHGNAIQNQRGHLHHVDRESQMNAL
jgi:hypothetical protein